ncbi:hypothetical protein BGZ76_007698 [Entomortierella beljakovae]|nr:hypothetical protein BGZ76_007698 [Entomortierella beljakovae]
MSLYGDLPPPSSSTDSDSSSVKKQASENKDGPTPGSSTSVKSALPAGWSSSITRFKPMLNRKLVPPKPKPNVRSIPAGFVAQTKSEVQTTSTTAPVISASATSTSIAATERQSASKIVQNSESTLDDSSWLKARTAQVQRQDVDGLASIRKQMKKQPVKGHAGPLLLDDEYDIARPNEYEEFKMLFEEEQRLKEEEKQRLKDQGRASGGRSRRSRSRSASPQDAVIRGLDHILGPDPVRDPEVCPGLVQGHHPTQGIDLGRL